jgi:hypothetical protein
MDITLPSEGRGLGSIPSGSIMEVVKWQQYGLPCVIRDMQGTLESLQGQPATSEERAAISRNVSDLLPFLAETAKPAITTDQLLEIVTIVEKLNKLKLLKKRS